MLAVNTVIGVSEYMRTYYHVLTNLQDMVGDMIQADNKPKDALQVPEGPITRQRTKRLREAMAGLVQSFMADCNKQIETHVGFNREGPKPLHLAQINFE